MTLQASRPQQPYVTDWRYARARTEIMGWSRSRTEREKRSIEQCHTLRIAVDWWWERAVLELWQLHCMSPHMEYGGNQG